MSSNSLACSNAIVIAKLLLNMALVERGRKSSPGNVPSCVNKDGLSGLPASSRWAVGRPHF